MGRSPPKSLCKPQGSPALDGPSRCGQEQVLVPANTSPCQHSPSWPLNLSSEQVHAGQAELRADNDT